MTDRPQHAVVIGGSVAGLLAARVLTDHAHTVTILERDELPDDPRPRPGVPQGAHVHALLPGGAAAIERLLPGIGAEMAAAGSPVLDLAHDVAWLSKAGWGVRFRSPLRILTGTRQVLEWAVRRRVVTLPGIEVRAGVAVSGLLASSGVVRGVALTSGEQIEADVVIDASGRASRAPAWLRGIGHGAPAETVVDADLAYASQLIEAPSDAIPGARAAYVQVAPPEHRRGGIAFPVGPGRFLLTVVGTCGDHPPRDQAGFESFARSLRDPILADLVEAGSPGSPIAVFGATSNRFRHYERLSDRPDGFVVTGDAACAFNPVYGQGMSAAALSAEALANCLAADASPRGLARRFPSALRAAVRVPWMLTTGADFEAAGIQPPVSARLMNRYIMRVMRAATHNHHARLAMLEVMGLMKPPSALFAPPVVRSALRATTPATPQQADAMKVRAHA